MRRTVIVGAIALVVVLVLGFLFFFTNSSEPSGGEQSSGGGFFGSLFPFNFGGGNDPLLGEPGTEEPGVDTRPVPKLRQVSRDPVGGGFLFASERASTTIRYIERATGHVFETSTDTLTTRRISNTTIPGVYEVLWEDGNNFIIRYFGESLEPETVAVSLAETEGEQTINGTFLPSWDRATLDPERETLFSITETASGASASLARADGSNPRSVLASPISSWIPLQSEDDLYLHTAPASRIPGFLYRVVNQNLVRVLGPRLGLLSVVSPSGRFVLFSDHSERGISLSVLDTTTNEVQELPLATFATKCAFISEAPLRVFCGVPSEFPDGDYPTDWLLGKTELRDDLWLIELPQGSATFLAAPFEDEGVALDVTSIVTNESGSYVGFVNNNDLSFWVFDLRE